MNSEDQRLIRRQINQICDQFEDAWLAGEQPNITDFVSAELEPHFQHELFAALLDLEIFYRKENQLSISLDHLKSSPHSFKQIVDQKLRQLWLEKKKEKKASAVRKKVLEKDRHLLPVHRSTPAIKHAPLEELLAKATAGDRVAQEELLEQHRSYLRLIAERELGSEANGRMNAAGVVQETCLEAIKKFADFKGASAKEFFKWLRELHQNKIDEELRFFISETREIVDEREINSQDADEIDLTPHRRLLEGEQAVVLAQALDMLPESQREAVRLRHLEGWSVRQITTQLDATPESVAGLIYHGVSQLRQILKPGI